MTHTPQTVAADALRYFTTVKRSNGDVVAVRVNDAPKWTANLIWAAHEHGAILPDDWRYQWCVDALGWIADGDDLDEVLPGVEDCYNHKRLEWWASSIRRAAYANEAQAEYGPCDDIMTAIGYGMALEAREVAQAVQEYINARVDALNDAEQEG